MIAFKIRVIAEGLYPTLPICGSPFTFLSLGLLVLAVALVLFVCDGLAVCVRSWNVCNCHCAMAQQSEWLGLLTACALRAISRL